MEELELLKNDWNKNTEDFKEYSDQDILGMIKKQSVSVTKTLLIIGVVEVIIWSAYGYIDGEFPFIRIGLFTIFFGLIIYWFNKIKSGESSLALMKNILNLRKTVFGYAGISFALIIFDSLINFKHHTSDFIRGWKDGQNGTHSDTVNLTMVNYIVFAFILAAVIYFLYWIYKKTYGKILSDLKKNYRELSKAE
ncbi:MULTISPECIES: hypothetical protein [unclassified Chryseobacterium]|uniref:hypothetical protein n=1 Tax=unclassified Chryseobacterium TaxID=2593645 RepID=UPI00226AA1C9|nr:MULTISPECIES: hypothetical protein [unclassified Chryseobacterium]